MGNNCSSHPGHAALAASFSTAHLARRCAVANVGCCRAHVTDTNPAFPSPLSPPSPTPREHVVQLGTYDPIPHRQDGVKEVRLAIDRVKYWLSVGAQPSDRVAFLLWRAGMMPAPPLHYTPTASIPKEERRAAEKAKKGFHTMTEAAAAAYAARAAALSVDAASTGAPALPALGLGTAVTAMRTSVLRARVDVPAAFSGAFVRRLPFLL